VIEVKRLNFFIKFLICWKKILSFGKIMEKFTKICIFVLVASLCLNAIVPVESSAIFYDVSFLELLFRGGVSAWEIY
jgi:hypothetical protein